MRNSLAMLLVATIAGSAGVAAAQPSEAVVVVPAERQPTSGMWLDFGVGATRIAPGDGQTYRGEYIRFAPQVTVGRLFYVGAEMDIGSFDGAVGVVGASNATAARGEGGNGGSPAMSLTVDGKVAAAKVVAGARLIAGAFSGGLELAGGVRYTTLSAAIGSASNSVGTGVVEARGRLDLWVTPHVTVGALAGTDIARRDETTFALNVGFHFEPFDHPRY